MLNLNWDRICVMVVDDNAFMRRLLASALGAFGIRKIVQEPDGSAAVERLRLSKTDPVQAVLGEVDLILSDYLMPGVDGNLFLRWIRTDEASPNRFVPFVLVSGAANRDVVEDARNAGVTEILAKPFSVNSLSERVLSVINHPRQFILARGYFGPERRRNNVQVDEERRETAPDQVQVVKPDSDVRKLRDDVRAIHFRPDNPLRVKLGPEAMRKPVEFDPQVLRAAEARIQSLVGDYADWVEKYIQSMSDSLAALMPSTTPLKRNRQHIANINRIAHELHGQGGTFDYQLITDFGLLLFRATNNPDTPVTENTSKLIEAHIDSIRTVFKNRIQGTGGETGALLLCEIERAVKKYT